MDEKRRPTARQRLCLLCPAWIIHGMLCYETYTSYIRNAFVPRAVERQHKQSAKWIIITIRIHVRRRFATSPLSPFSLPFGPLKGGRKSSSFCVPFFLFIRKCRTTANRRSWRGCNVQGGRKGMVSLLFNAYLRGRKRRAMKMYVTRCGGE